MVWEWIILRTFIATHARNSFLKPKAHSPKPFPMSDANYYASLTPKPVKKRGARIVILISSLLVVVPVIIEEIPREQARWYQAAAQQSLDAENFDLALQQVGRAIALDPHQYAFHLLQSSIFEKRFKAKKSKSPDQDLTKALDCIARARKEATRDLQQLAVEFHAADFAHSVAHWKEAADQYKKILDIMTLSNYGRAQMLNGYAYNAALANVDLDTALSDVNEALDLITGDRRLDKDTLADGKSSILDTRAYVRYRRGEYTLALEDIEQSLQLFGSVKGKKLLSADNDLVRAVDVKQMKYEIIHTWAVMLYHRMLINDVLGIEQPQRRQIVASDEEAIKDLGFTPGPHLY